MPDFLLEIGLEEVPARMLEGARLELEQRLVALLHRERLAIDAAPVVNAFATPRRLAVLATGISAAQPDVEEQVTGPAVKVAFKDGAPTAAAEAFAKKVGRKVADLSRTSTPKGEYLSATVLNKGRNAAEVLAQQLPREIAGLYWAKNMYWRGKGAERFVRPVRWILALLDSGIVPLEFGGITAGDSSRGHRILGEAELSVAEPAQYEARLKQAFVIVAPAQREHIIRKALDAATRTVVGARWREDAALLATVVNLCEFPSVILGSFDREFLKLPEEVLVTVMRDHQKYFAVEDEHGKLAPHFLAVLNIDGDPDGLIRHGNERVLRARFNDAAFFWQTDQKLPLEKRIDLLKNVTFQKDLGSYYEKAHRMARLVDILAADLDSPERRIDRNALHESAWLAKTDLTTELVKEFTELQGVIGGLYARAQGLPPAVADAIYDHYKPASTDEAVPRTIESALLSIADKADSIAGMFALGLQPSGSKDPFALRRQANGIIKTIAEQGLELDLANLFQLALGAYKSSEAEKKFKDLDRYAQTIAGFLRERLEFYLRDVRGFAYDEVNAVLAAGADSVVDALARVQAVAQVRRSESTAAVPPEPQARETAAAPIPVAASAPAAGAFESISVAFKRIKNILRQARESNRPPAAKYDSALADDPAEKELARLAAETGPRVAQLREQKDYTVALAEIAKLRPALDLFFDKVMVMVDDEKVRGNRLALLESLLRDFSTIADFSEIVTEGK